MTIERNNEGAYVISDIINGCLVTKRYYGYNKKQAIKLFREGN